MPKQVACPKLAEAPVLIFLDSTGGSLPLKCLCSQTQSPQQHARFCVQNENGVCAPLYEAVADLVRHHRKSAGASSFAGGSATDAAWPLGEYGELLVPHSALPELKEAFAEVVTAVVDAGVGGAGPQRVKKDASWAVLLLLLAEAGVALPPKLHTALTHVVESLADRRLKVGPISVTFPEQHVALLKRLAVESHVTKRVCADALAALKANMRVDLEARAACSGP